MNDVRPAVEQAIQPQRRVDVTLVPNDWYITQSFTVRSRSDQSMNFRAAIRQGASNSATHESGCAGQEDTNTVVAAMRRHRWHEFAVAVANIFS
jgi:capsule polysaccharide export protein KpsE/RkpR